MNIFKKKTPLSGYFRKWTKKSKKCLSIIFFLFVGLLQVAASTTYSQLTKFTFDLEDVTVSQVLSQIESDSQFYFTYNTSEINPERLVSVHLQENDIHAALKQLFDGENIYYVISDKHVVLYKDTRQNYQVSVQQGITVTGIVTDNDGEPLPGVNVVIKGTTTGTVTESNGSYSITVPDGNVTLEFSFIGFISQEFPIGNRTFINVMLIEDTKLLEEVVVVGYGVQKKATVTGAISSMSSDVLIQSPVANVSNALAGRMSGLLSVQRNGDPGNDASTLRVRGVGTFSGSADPLILVDGVESMSYNNIDFNEIDDIAILKDASATAVFGVRGANGVIIITTKRGKMGKPVLSVTSNVGLQTFTNVRENLGSYEYALYYNEARRYDSYATGSNNPRFSAEDIEHYRLGDDPIFYPDTDWLSLLLKPLSMQTQHNVNIRGGTDKVRYFVSLGYFSQDGLFNNTDVGGFNAQIFYKRYNIRTNFDFDITKRLSAHIDVSSMFGTRGSPAGGDNLSYIINRITIAPPFHSPGLVDGKIVNVHDVFHGNPLEHFLGSGYNRNFTNDLNTSVRLEYQLDFITQGLKVHGRVSNLNRMNNRKRYSKSVQTYKPILLDNGTILYLPQKAESPFGFSESSGKNRDTYFEVGLNYDRTFGSHAFGGLLLYNQKKLYDPSLAYVIPNGHQGLVGRITYNYKMRYMAEFNMGYNGTENFAAGRRFGFFPAYSLSWVASEEPFFPKNNIISYIKIRGSYGEVGKDNIPGTRFLYLPSTFVYDSREPDFNTTWNQGGYFFGTPGSTFQIYRASYESSLGNPNLTWERAKKTDVGIDMVLINNKIRLTLDYFYEYRNNILTTPGTTPQIVGITLPASNWGEMKNSGYEGEISYTDRINKFDYWIKGNYSYAHNVIVFQDEVPRLYPHMRRTGQSYGQPFGYIAEGFYNTWEEINDPNRPRSSHQNNRLVPGDVKFRDINGDGIIDQNDQVPIGYPNFPEIIYGMSFGGSYKGFDFSLLFQGAAHVSRMLSNTTIRPYENQGAVATFIPEFSWTQEKYETGQTIKLPRLTSDLTQTHNYNNSTFMLQNCSYLRLKNAEIGYSFKSELLKQVHINSCRIFMNGNNLLTWCGLFPGIDPEQLEFSGDVGYYPLTRTFNLGINVQF